MHKMPAEEQALFGGHLVFCGLTKLDNIFFQESGSLFFVRADNEDKLAACVLVELFNAVQEFFQLFRLLSYAFQESVNINRSDIEVLRQHTANKTVQSVNA